VWEAHRHRGPRLKGVGRCGRFPRVEVWGAFQGGWGHGWGQWWTDGGVRSGKATLSPPAADGCSRRFSRRWRRGYPKEEARKKEVVVGRGPQALLHVASPPSAPQKG
jgi:hypothetical protein